jgi:hypothetical protein
MNVHFNFVLDPVPLNTEKRLIETDILTVRHIQIRFTQTEIINGIQDIRLTGSILTNKTIDIGRECDLCLLVVLEIDKMNGPQMHWNKFT